MIHSNDMILAKGQYYDMDCYKTQLNNNVVVVGGSGCGKTRGVVIPNILQATGSYIISDPKGNLYDKYATYLYEKGYVVKKLDFSNPMRSIHYNFFHYIRSVQDVLKISHMITYADDNENKRIDPFWDESACILLQALIAYVRFTCKPNEWTLSNLLQLLTLAQINENDDTIVSPLDVLFDNLRSVQPDHFAVKQYDKFKSGAGKTMKSIVITVFSKLGMYDTPEMAWMMSKDEIEVESIGTRKTALFVVVSDTDRSMDTMVNLFFTQIMNELCLYADRKCKDQSLPIHVRFIMDDFATNCKIMEFPRIISSIRSRNISTMIMLQAESQLRSGYDKDDKTILANCDTYVYYGGNDIETAEAVSKRSDQAFNDIMNMPIGKCWIFRRGSQPVYADIMKPEEYRHELYGIDYEKINEKPGEKRRIKITGFCPAERR